MKDDGKGVSQKTAETLTDSIAQILRLASEASAKAVGPTQPGEVGEKENWTIMVFMSADDSLLPFAEIDIREMQKVGSLGPHDNLHIFVELHQKAGDPAFRFKVGEALEELTSMGGVGNKTVLIDFLRWVTGRRPDDRYMLVLWGHAYRFGFGRFDDDLLMLDELTGALENFFNSGKRLDILGCDACAMSKVDIAHALKDTVKYLVASQTVIPFSGWPYQKVLKEFRDNSGLGSLELAKRTLKHYRDSYEPPSVTLTALDLTKQKAFTDALEELGQILAKETATSADRQAEVRLAFREAARDDGEQLFDLQDLCDQLRQKTDSHDVKEAAEKVIAELAVGAFVAGHERRGPETSRLNGVGILQFASPDEVTQILRKKVQRKEERDGVVPRRGLKRWPGWQRTIENVTRPPKPPVPVPVVAKQRT